jgi:hypothetical protein
MAAIRRRSLRGAVGVQTTLATADDLDGTQDGTQNLDVSGCAGAIIIQHNNGTLGTAGIDVLEQSTDGGITWIACDTVMLLSANPFTGTVVASAALNAAGVEPTNMAVFKAGPFRGPALLRIGRKTTTNLGTTWVTGAPTVVAASIR